MRLDHLSDSLRPHRARGNKKPRKNNLLDSSYAHPSAMNTGPTPPANGIHGASRTRHGTAATEGRLNGVTTGDQGVSGGQFQSKEEKSSNESYFYKLKVTPSDPLTPTSPPGNRGGGQHPERSPKNRRKLERKVQIAKECMLRADSGLFLEGAVGVLNRLRRAYRAWDAARRELLEGLLPLVRDAAPDLWGGSGSGWPRP